MNKHRFSLLKTLPAAAIGRVVFPPSRRGGRTNLALDRPATQSSISQRWSAKGSPEEDARGANNGVATRAQGFHTDKQPFPWWEVDLGALSRLSEVLIYNREQDADRLRHFSIFASLDGEQWIEIFRKADDSVFGATSRAPYVAKLPDGSVARVVRIQANATTFMHFSECAVYGEVVPKDEVEATRAAFARRVQSEEQRMCQPSAATDPTEIDLELSMSQALHPFSSNAMSRNVQRAWVLDLAKRRGVGAEIGVFRGHFSEVILRTLRPRKFYMVDPWRELGETFDWSDFSNDGTLPTTFAMREAELRTRKFPSTESVLVEEFFPEGVRIPEPLDWIYLDASHDYARVLRDLEASAELIRPDGVIMGDDFWPQPGKPHPGVVRAVHDFVDSHPFQFVAGGLHGQWCIRRRPADKGGRRLG